MDVIKIFRKVSLIIGIIGLIAAAVTIYQFINPFLQIDLSFDIVSIFLFAAVIIIFILFFSYGIYNLNRKIQVSRSIKHQIEQINGLKKRRNDTAAFKEWKSTTESILRNFFGEDTANLKEFKKIRYYLGFGSTTEAQNQKAYERGLEEAKGFLKARLNELKQKF